MTKYLNVFLVYHSKRKLYLIVRYYYIIIINILKITNK